MQSLDEIKQRLESAKPLIQQKYHVNQIGIFVSMCEENKHKTAMLMSWSEFEPGFRFGLLTFCELENFLSDLLGLKVDLVMKKGLKSHIGEQNLTRSCLSMTQNKRLGKHSAGFTRVDDFEELAILP